MSETAENRELLRCGPHHKSTSISLTRFAHKGNWSLAFLPSYQKYAYRNTLPAPRISSIFGGLAFALVASFALALPANAQVCTPGCTPPLQCVWTDGTHTATTCYDPNEDIVVTANRGGGTTFASLVYGVVVPLVDLALMPLLYAIAFVVFLIGMVRLFFSDSEEKRKSGKDFALWGIIGFAVLFSVWGIVRLLLTLLPTG